ncbi:hypothetical protein BDV59DRAFT_157984 [Aspergillus ambiguus]|uniref:uncharacterized protein n=1 Tax=Aspergillus ambiguus TaxID=176160 RepID=UPI003CCDC151
MIGTSTSVCLQEPSSEHPPHLYRCWPVHGPWRTGRYAEGLVETSRVVHSDHSSSERSTSKEFSSPCLSASLVEVRVKPADGGCSGGSKDQIPSRWRLMETRRRTTTNDNSAYWGHRQNPSPSFPHAQSSSRLKSSRHRSAHAAAALTEWILLSKHGISQGCRRGPRRNEFSC